MSSSSWKSPAESGAVLRTRRVLVGQRGTVRLVDAVFTLDTNSDTETGSPTLNRREAGSPERGGVGWFVELILGPHRR